MFGKDASLIVERRLILGSRCVLTAAQPRNFVASEFTFKELLTELGGGLYYCVEPPFESQKIRRGCFMSELH